MTPTPSAGKDLFFTRRVRDAGGRRHCRPCESCRRCVVSIALSIPQSFITLPESRLCVGPWHRLALSSPLFLRSADSSPLPTLPRALARVGRGHVSGGGWARLLLRDPCFARDAACCCVLGSIAAVRSDWFRRRTIAKCSRSSA